eukprot:m51a1_g10984 hypothetical protein (111) ;mRNA; r:317172-317719
MDTADLKCYRKLFSVQLGAVREAPGKAFTLPPLTFRRVWIQGVVVRSSPGLIEVDDGTGVTAVAGQPQVGPGLGTLAPGSAWPNRESLWHLEVIETQMALGVMQPLLSAR